MMKNIKLKLDNLDSYIQLVRKAILYIIIFEAVLVILIGIASSNLYHEKYATVFVITLILSTLIYVIILAFKYIYQKSIPNSIVDDLKASYELQALNQKYERNVATNQAINSTIDEIKRIDTNSLIHVSSEADPNDLLKSEIDKALLPLKKCLDTIFNKPNAKFTLGIALKDKKRKLSADTKISSNYIFRDDLDIGSTIDERVFTDDNLTGWLLELQSFFKSCINHEEIETSSFTKGNSLVCCPIKINRGFIGQIGVLFIISDMDKSEIPADAKSIVIVFTNLVATWMELFMLNVLSSAVKNIGKSLTDAFTKKEK